MLEARGNLDDILCEQHKRTVSADSCVRFERLVLQIHEDAITSGLECVSGPECVHHYTTAAWPCSSSASWLTTTE